MHVYATWLGRGWVCTYVACGTEEDRTVHMCHVARKKITAYICICGMWHGRGSDHTYVLCGTTEDRTIHMYYVRMAEDRCVRVMRCSRG